MEYNQSSHEIWICDNRNRDFIRESHQIFINQWGAVLNIKDNLSWVPHEGWCFRSFAQKKAKNETEIKMKMMMVVRISLPSPGNNKGERRKNINTTSSVFRTQHMINVEFLRVFVVKILHDDVIHFFFTRSPPTCAFI